MKKILILLPLLLFLRALSSGAGIDTLYPNANGTYQQWTAKGGGNHYTEVDDPVGSADTGTYVYLTNHLNYRTTQAVDNFCCPDSTIDSASTYLRVKKTGTGTITAAFLWYDGTNTLNGGSLTLTTSYANFLETHSTNLIGGAWTATDINNLQAGMLGTANSSSRYIFWTQLYVYIYFHSATGGSRKKHTILEGGTIK